VCCPSEQPPPIEKRTLSPTEEAVVAFFSDAATVERLVDLLCAEPQNPVKFGRLFFWQVRVDYIYYPSCIIAPRTEGGGHLDTLQ